MMILGSIFNQTEPRKHNSQNFTVSVISQVLDTDGTASNSSDGFRLSTFFDNVRTDATVTRFYSHNDAPIKASTFVFVFSFLIFFSFDDQT